jgi:hypothetical protein
MGGAGTRLGRRNGYVPRERLLLGWLDASAHGRLFLVVLRSSLSALWSTIVPATISEVERDIVYPLGLLATLLVVRRRTVPQLLGGTLAGIVLICVYSLGTRLLPEHLGSFDPLAAYRLAAPLGYWNALGIFAAIGALLAPGFAVHARTFVLRMVAPGTLSSSCPLCTSRSPAGLGLRSASACW